MDVDDLDMDFDPDPIVSFFFHKLDQVKNLKEELASTVADLEDIASTLRTRQQNGSCNDSLEVLDVWKRIFRGKYVVGIEVRNKSDSTINSIQLILQWKSAQSPLTKTQIYSTQNKSFVEALPSQQAATVLVAINHVDFTRSPDQDANCILLYDHVQTPPRSLTFSVGDFGTAIDVRSLDAKEALLAAMAGQNRIELVARLMGNVKRKLEHYLTIDCMLREFEGRHFYFERVSEVVDGSVVRVAEDDGVYSIDVYYRDNISLRNILHHIHRSVEHLYLLPARFEADLRNLKTDSAAAPFGGTQMFMSQMLNDVEASGGSELRKSLLEQVSVLTGFHVNVLEKGGCRANDDLSAEFGAVRNYLMSSEFRADVAFEKINEL